jgi:hypothetical protein
MDKNLFEDMVKLVVSYNGNGAGQAQLQEKVDDGTFTKEQQTLILLRAQVLLLVNKVIDVERKVSKIS